MRIVMALVLAFCLAPWLALARPAGDLLAGVVPGADGKIDVLTVFAHQDDETISLGGTLIKIKDDPRVRLHVMCMTLGDVSEAKEFLGITQEKMGEIRVAELRLAASIYPAEQIIQLDYHDASLAQADPAELEAKILETIERVGAELMLTHEPAGITGHPDHITTSRVATAAFKNSSAQKLYYTTLPRSIYAIFKMASPTISKQAPPAPVFSTMKVSVRDQMKLKKLAMYSHVSQRHFSLVSIAMKAVTLIDHEWFALAAEN